MKKEGPQVGHLVEGNEERDAIHVPVIPVIAGDYLNPGEHVGIMGSRRNLTATRSADPVGIIDPFLKQTVNRGQKCWLFVYPGTIVSLRHNWEHPAFEKVDDDPNVQASMRWMEDIADRFQRREPDSYEWLMEEADKIVSGEEDYITFSTDSYRGEFDAEEFWHHYSVIRGKVATPGNVFTCMC
jgi:hypothetical protein